MYRTTSGGRTPTVFPPDCFVIEKKSVKCFLFCGELIIFAVEMMDEAFAEVPRALKTDSGALRKPREHEKEG